LTTTTTKIQPYDTVLTMKFFLFATTAVAAALCSQVSAFSMSMNSESASNRRAFITKAATSAAAVLTASTLQSTGVANAAPTIYNLNSGVKYAIIKDVTKGSYSQQGDIVAIEYTGYLTNGAIFDATHSEGKRNALLFKLGSPVVVPGINEMVSEMKVGQKVQAIVPPELAFGENGICLENGDCLVKPGSTLVYDIFLKKSSIPPP
jgi:FKBP-type peptidyl-prolyl cis-trans isomerase